MRRQIILGFANREGFDFELYIGKLRRDGSFLTQTSYDVKKESFGRDWSLVFYKGERVVGRFNLSYGTKYRDAVDLNSAAYEKAVEILCDIAAENNWRPVDMVRERTLRPSEFEKFLARTESMMRIGTRLESR